MPHDDRKREWVFLLEASSYMADRRVALIRAVNATLREAKASDRRTMVSLYFFREWLLPVVAAVSLEDMPELCEDDLFPAGECALFDAVGEVIQQSARYQAERAAHTALPGETVFFVFTRGVDTASVRLDYPEMRARMTHHEASFGWRFRFPMKELKAVPASPLVGRFGS